MSKGDDLGRFLAQAISGGVRLGQNYALRNLDQLKLDRLLRIKDPKTLPPDTRPPVVGSQGYAEIAGGDVVVDTGGGVIDFVFSAEWRYGLFVPPSYAGATLNERAHISAESGGATLDWTQESQANVLTPSYSATPYAINNWHSTAGDVILSWRWETANYSRQPTPYNGGAER